MNGSQEGGLYLQIDSHCLDHLGFYQKGGMERNRKALVMCDL